MKVSDISFLQIAKFDPVQLDRTAAAPSTLLVPPDFDAVAAVRIAELNRKRLILSVNPANPSRYEGMLVLEWVGDRLREKKGIQAATLGDALSILESDPIERARQYRHEWLNFERPNVGWCDRGQHIALLPCTENHD